MDGVWYSQHTNSVMIINGKQFELVGDDSYKFKKRKNKLTIYSFENSFFGFRNYSKYNYHITTLNEDSLIFKGYGKPDRVLDIFGGDSVSFVKSDIEFYNSFMRKLFEK